LGNAALQVASWTTLLVIHAGMADSNLVVGPTVLASLACWALCWSYQQARLSEQTLALSAVRFEGEVQV